MFPGGSFGHASLQQLGVVGLGKVLSKSLVLLDCPLFLFLVGDLAFWVGCASWFLSACACGTYF